MKRDDGFRPRITPSRVMRKLVLLLLAGCAAEVSESVEELGLPPVPVLFSTRDHQSLVHGARDEAVVIGGDNLDIARTTLVYAPIADTTSIPAHPAYPAPGGPIITPVAADAHTLQLVLPAAITAGVSYVMWPVNSDLVTKARSWGPPILLNDARPMWISPSWVYATHVRPGLGLGRRLKVVGRNLEPAPGFTTQICYVPSGAAAPTVASPCPAAMMANALTSSTDPARSFVTEFAVPPLLANTTYWLYVRRDGTSWVEVPRQQLASGAATLLEVRRDPVIGSPVRISSMASSAQFDTCGDPANEKVCQPNDGKDDSCCILNAIHQAHAQITSSASSTTPITSVDVVFDDVSTCTSCEGWLVAPPPSFHTPPSSTQQGVSVVADAGFSIPPGVNLVGIRNFNEVPVRRNRITQLAPSAIQLFGLNGKNVVSHLAMRTHRVEQPSHPVPRTVSLVRSSEDVVITDSTFEPAPVLANGSTNRAAIKAAIFGRAEDPGAFRGLVVTDSFLAADSLGIAMAAPMTDAIIARNTIIPGPSSFGEANDVLAISWPGGARNDISGNTIDGSDPTYASQLQQQGFRGGIYTHSTASHDRELISNNLVACAGFRPGTDGEGISIDENGGARGFLYAKEVLDVKPQTNGHEIVVSDDDLDPYHVANGISGLVGLTVTLVSGAGQGQARTISSASWDVVAHRVSLVVRPAFDVAPQRVSRSAQPSDSAIVVGRSHRQVFVVGNSVDGKESTRIVAHQGPACVASSPSCSCVSGFCVQPKTRSCPTTTRSALGFADVTGPSHNGGLVVLWGADWAITNNRLESTSGILTRVQYMDYCKDNAPVHELAMPSLWGEIRGNHLLGGTSSFDTGGIALRSDIDFEGSRVPGTMSCTTGGGAHTVKYRLGIGISVANNDIATPSRIGTDAGGDFAVPYPNQGWLGLTPIKSMINVVGYSSSVMAWSPGYLFTTIASNRITYSDPPSPGTFRFGILDGDLMLPNGPSKVDATSQGWGNHPQHTLVCGNTVTDPAGPVPDAPPAQAPFYDPEPGYQLTTKLTCATYAP